MPGLFLVKCAGSVSPRALGWRAATRKPNRAGFALAILRSFAKPGKEGRGDGDPDAVALGVPPAPASCPPNHDCFMRSLLPSVRKMGCGVNYWGKKYTKS